MHTSPYDESHAFDKMALLVQMPGTLPWLLENRRCWWAGRRRELKTTTVHSLIFPKRLAIGLGSR